MDQETVVAVSLGAAGTKIISLADVVAEYFRLQALATERELDHNEQRVLSALTITLGSMVTHDGADRLYEALKAEEAGKDDG